MNDIENFILCGKPIPKKEAKPVTDEELYWHMHEQGKKRFGAECPHKDKVNGRCTNCLRKVI